MQVVALRAIPYVYRLIESSSVKKDLRVMDSEKLIMGQECALAA